jgi:hypothetical protein
MNNLEKIGLDYILQIAIDAKMHLYRSNNVDLPEGTKDSEWVEGNEKLKKVIELLTMAVN